MNAIAVRDACNFIAALEHLAPVVHVLGGIGNDDGSARGAAAAVDAHDLLFRHGSQSQRIRLAQVGLLAEGKLLEIGLGLYTGQVDALELLRIERGTILEVLELLGKQRELVGGHLHSLIIALVYSTPESAWFVSSIAEQFSAIKRSFTHISRARVNSSRSMASPRPA